MGILVPFSSTLFWCCIFRERMAPWRLRDATMAVAGPGLNADSFPIPSISRNGAPGRTAGVAGIAGRAPEWGRTTATAPPEGFD